MTDDPSKPVQPGSVPAALANGGESAEPRSAAKLRSWSERGVL